MTTPALLEQGELAARAGAPATRLPNRPPARSKVAGALAAIACAACCALPLLIAAGVLTGPEPLSAQAGPRSLGCGKH